MLNGTSYTWDDEEQKIMTVYVTIVSIPGRASNHSAINNDLVQQSTRLKLGERAFSRCGTLHLESTTRPTQYYHEYWRFKRDLKTFLFQSAYCNTH